MLRRDWEFIKYLRENGEDFGTVMYATPDMKIAEKAFHAGYERACDYVSDITCGCGTFVNVPYEIVDEKTGKAKNE